MERDSKTSHFFDLRETVLRTGKQEKPDETLVGNMMRLIKSSRVKIAKPKMPPVPQPLPHETTSPG